MEARYIVEAVRGRTVRVDPWTEDLTFEWQLCASFDELGTAMEFASSIRLARVIDMETGELFEIPVR